MKKYIISLIGLLTLCFAYPQSIEREIFSSSGITHNESGLQTEWTIGEIITEEFSRESYLLTQGFHQGLLSALPGIPDTLILRDLILSEPTDTCFSATKTIILAGNASSFIVENGASSILVAGNNILFLQGTHVHHGANLHAYITTDSNYCSKPPALLADNSPDPDAGIYLSDKKQLDELLMAQLNIGAMKCRVFPNPTTGIIGLEFSKTSNEHEMFAEIISPFGERLLLKECFAGNLYHFDLSGRPSGIYFLRVFQENQSLVLKIIKM
jgi:hypothetical protein